MVFLILQFAKTNRCAGNHRLVSKGKVEVVVEKMKESMKRREEIEEKRNNGVEKVKGTHEDQEEEDEDEAGEEKTR